MKTNKPAMSHNACYDSVAHRWLIAPNDIVLYCSDAGFTYAAYVDSVSITTVDVVCFIDGVHHIVHYSDSDLNLRLTSYCDLMIRWLRYDDSAVLYKQGDEVIDCSFDGTMSWFIDKFDKERGRAFLCANISGRRIGHWQYLNNIVHK